MEPVSFTHVTYFALLRVAGAIASTILCSALLVEAYYNCRSSGYQLHANHEHVWLHNSQDSENFLNGANTALWVPITKRILSTHVVFNETRCWQTGSLIEVLNLRVQRPERNYTACPAKQNNKQETARA
jgi:hypothetical protein